MKPLKTTTSSASVSEVVEGSMTSAGHWKASRPLMAYELPVIRFRAHSPSEMRCAAFHGVGLVRSLASQKRSFERVSGRDGKQKHEGFAFSYQP